MPASQRYFALFGAKRTGKTAYLASLYATSGDAGDGGQAYHVSASDDPDDPTHPYLGRLGRALKAGQWPDSSPFERLTELKIRDQQGQLELKKEILAHYQDYHGFLIFIPADLTDPGQAAESKWEVDVLLNVLQERVAEGRTRIARPIALLVTKWDLIEPGPITEASEAQAGDFLESVHPELTSGLGTLCENLRIFPVSATGPLVAGQPPTPLRPTNLGEPIAWLVETAERVMLERAQAYVEQNRSRLFRRDRGDAQRRTYQEIAIERLNHFLEDVPHGPLAEEALGQIEELRALLVRRRVQSAGIAALIVIFLAITAFGSRDYRVSRQAHGLLEETSPDLTRRREVVARVNAVLDQPTLAHLVGHAFTWWRALRRDLETYRRDFEIQSFEALERSHSSVARNDEKGARDLLQRIGTHEENFPDSRRLAEVAAFRSDAEAIVRNIEENLQMSRISEENREFKAHPEAPGLASKLRVECDAFLKDHSGSDQVSTVQAIRAEVQAVEITTTQARDYGELQLQLTQAAKSPWRCYQLCTEFLKNDPSHPKAREVDADRGRFLAKADDQAWAEVIRHARTSQSLFKDQITKCEEYMHNAQFTAHQVEANEFKKQAVRGYDRDSYEDIRTRAGDNDDPVTLQAVRKLCSGYLNVPIPGKTMTAEVNGWAKWFDDWGRGREFSVRVSSVRIERDSAWHYRLSIPDPWVHATVQVGAKTYSTGDKSIPLDRDERDLPDDRLGPFTWKWGDPDVVVSLFHKDASPPHFSSSFADSDAFKVRHLNGLTSFNCGKIAVRLECPEAVPPSLPPYKE